MTAAQLFTSSVRYLLPDIDRGRITVIGIFPISHLIRFKLSSFFSSPFVWLLSSETTSSFTLSSALFISSMLPSVQEIDSLIWYELSPFAASSWKYLVINSMQFYTKFRVTGGLYLVLTQLQWILILKKNQSLWLMQQKSLCSSILGLFWNWAFS